MGSSSVIEERLSLVNVQEVFKKEGYSEEQVKNLLCKDALILPLYTTLAVKEVENVELLTLEMVQLKKILSEKINVEVVRNQEKEHRYLELASAEEIVVPVIVFFALSTWDICKDIIANWIYSKFESLMSGKQKPNAKFEFEIRDEKNGVFQHLKYSGPADEVSKLIRKIKFK